MCDDIKLCVGCERGCGSECWGGPKMCSTLRRYVRDYGSRHLWIKIKILLKLRDLVIRRLRSNNLCTLLFLWVSVHLYATVYGYVRDRGWCMLHRYSSLNVLEPIDRQISCTDQPPQKHSPEAENHSSFKYIFGLIISSRSEKRVSFIYHCRIRRLADYSRQPRRWVIRAPILWAGNQYYYSPFLMSSYMFFKSFSTGLVVNHFVGRQPLTSPAPHKTHHPLSPPLLGSPPINTSKSVHVIWTQNTVCYGAGLCSK